ncbi:MAG: hypothetical protein CM15mP120_12260 [Pseudomonadota bacterium]|nr:MAG: hypothetical protein CM15mP120_12260 [Pseudomonadota bacterium]
MIANPQNPTGRAYTLPELEALAEFVERNDLILVSDEIHCNIVLAENAQHLPIAQVVRPLPTARSAYLQPPRPITFLAWVRRGDHSRSTTTSPVSRPRGGTCIRHRTTEHCGFRDCFQRQKQLVRRIIGTASQQCAKTRTSRRTRMTPVEATYLAWVNIADLGINDVAAHFEAHGLGISDGAQFGHPDYIRFNFACPDELLTEGLQRLGRALSA